MTDKELSANVATLLGWIFVPPESHENALARPARLSYPRWIGPHGMEHYSEDAPPYATDWAWCGPLIEKNNVQVSGGRQTPNSAGDWDAYCLVWEKGYWVPLVEVTSDTPQRAICLAVIAAHQK